jgi:hypothetical protein
MAFVESAVVVYLREIYYPEGFEFPLKAFTNNVIAIEILREVATVFMLLSVAVITGRRLWERFAYFIFCFSVWDIFYYVWLKVLLDWPSTLLEMDILFLIPLPWVGPVIAPVSLSVLMIIFSLYIILLFYKGYDFKPTPLSIMLALTGTVVILFSFMRDTGATLRQEYPQPYMYELLLAGVGFYIAAFIISYRKALK